MCVIQFSWWLYAVDLSLSWQACRYIAVQGKNASQAKLSYQGTGISKHVIKCKIPFYISHLALCNKHQVFVCASHLFVCVCNLCACGLLFVSGKTSACVFIAQSTFLSTKNLWFGLKTAYFNSLCLFQSIQRTFQSHKHCIFRKFPVSTLEYLQTTTV